MRLNTILVSLLLSSSGLIAHGQLVGKTDKDIARAKIDSANAMDKLVASEADSTVKTALSNSKEIGGSKGKGKEALGKVGDESDKVEKSYFDELKKKPSGDKKGAASSNSKNPGPKKGKGKKADASKKKHKQTEEEYEAEYHRTMTIPSSNHHNEIDDKKGDDGDEEFSIQSAYHSFYLSLVMIIISEIGDKTFLIAAIMALSNPRRTVLAGALSALILMSILSAVMGHAVPFLLSKKLTNILAACLFFVFAIKMFKDGLSMRTSSVDSEIAEVESELAMSREKKLEEGANSSTSSRKTIGSEHGIKNLTNLLFSPVFVQTFVMTFIGEWGDRSQIATVAMAAGQDYWWVTLGAITGHTLCTIMAVLGGKLLASKISVRTVTLGGATLFVIFGVLYMYEATL